MSDAWLAQQGENQIDATKQEHPSFDARTRVAVGAFCRLAAPLDASASSARIGERIRSSNIIHSGGR